MLIIAGAFVRTIPVRQTKIDETKSGGSGSEELGPDQCLLREIRPDGLPAFGTASRSGAAGARPERAAHSPGGHFRPAWMRPGTALGPRPLPAAGRGARRAG